MIPVYYTDILNYQSRFEFSAENKNMVSYFISIS